MVGVGREDAGALALWRLERVAGVAYLPIIWQHFWQHRRRSQARSRAGASPYMNARERLRTVPLLPQLAAIRA